MLKFSEFLVEDLYGAYAAQMKGDKNAKAGSRTARQARQLKLTYFGFGRYGKNGEVTHIVQHDNLVPIYSGKFKNVPKDALNIHYHNKGYGNKYGSDLKKKDPEKYKKLLDKHTEITKYNMDLEKEANKKYKEKEKGDASTNKIVNDKSKEALEYSKLLKGSYDWRGLTPNEADSLYQYTEDAYRHVNSELVRISKSKTATIDDVKGKYYDRKSKVQSFKRIIHDLDNIMDKTESPIDFSTYAGVSSKFDLRPGVNYILPTYRSTTLDPKVANEFMNYGSRIVKNKRTMIQFNIKKGQKGMYVDGNNTRGAHSGELEFLLPRNTKFRIKGKPISMIHNDSHIEVYQAEIIPDEEIETTKKPTTSSTENKRAWTRPTEKNLKQEYNTEYKNHFKSHFGNIFPTYEKWKKAIQKGRVVEITPDIDEMIHNRSNTSNKKELHELIKGYASYPKYRNKKTLDNLYDRAKNGDNLDMPLIFQDKDGSLHIVSGNTRLDVAKHLKKTPKAIIFKK